MKLAVREELFEACQRELRDSLIEFNEQAHELATWAEELAGRETLLLRDADGAYYGMQRLLEASALALRSSETQLRESQARAALLHEEVARLRGGLDAAQARQAELTVALAIEENATDALREELLLTSRALGNPDVAQRQVEMAADELHQARAALALCKRQLAEERERVRIMMQAGEPLPRAAHLQRVLDSDNPSDETTPPPRAVRGHRALRYGLTVVIVGLAALWWQASQGWTLAHVFTSSARSIESSFASPAPPRVSKTRAKPPNQNAAARVR